MEWSPPSAKGTLPASSVFMTSSACLVQVAVISFRYFALAAPSFFCSGIATATLPPSSTTCPRASRRASRPATRTADGPISTPRRVCPRSRGTPRILIFLGTMLSASAGLAALSALGSVSTVVFSAVINFPSRIDTGQCPGEGNGFPHVLQRADPGDRPLNAHAEPGVRHAAVLAQVQVPLEGFLR